MDSKNQISIKVCELPDSRNLKNKVKDLLETDKNITSNQTISQNGITAYFLYKETPESYSADINFMKNHKNYYISASNVSYNKSDYFINNSKEIINSMQSNGNINYNRF
ncbi:hypothetical protein [Methanobrevibacter ruminantium]|uniref:hypothetical protein n=1 Tax=Methanobrevibacter ruminantium TaxID=83816 RepID=UPI00066220F0|nr:hypothetical protein [Methanobrevibacter ruminantium]